MFQVAWIGKVTGKIFQIHIRILHDISIDHSRVIRGSNSLCGDGNTKNLFWFILVEGDKFLDLVCYFLIVRTCIGISKWNGLGIDDFTIQINDCNMKHIFQNTDADGQTEIRDDPNSLSLATAGRVEISISLDQSFLFQKIQILTDR